MDNFGYPNRTSFRKRKGAITTSVMLFPFTGEDAAAEAAGAAGAAGAGDEVGL